MTAAGSHLYFASPSLAGLGFEILNRNVLDCAMPLEVWFFCICLRR